MPATPRITALNDSPKFLELVGDILTDDHYAVTLIDSDKPGTSAAIKASRPDILILDLRLGSEDPGAGMSFRMCGEIPSWPTFRSCYAVATSRAWSASNPRSAP